MNPVLRSRSSGQSIPLIALMIVVLFGMVGLSVDVGSTYAEQRGVVRAANASALAGIDAVIRGADDQTVATTIRESLLANGMKIESQSNPTGKLTYIARYMDVEGRHISNCEVGRCNTVPANTNYVEVKIGGTVDTYFARIVGRPTLPVGSTAYGYSCPPTNGVYPIAVWYEDIDFTKNQFSDKDRTGTLYPSDKAGTYVDKTYKDGKIWRRIFLKDNGNAPGNFSWMRWTQEKQGGTELAAALSGDGTLSDGFNEAPWPAGYTEAKPKNYPLSPKQLTSGDWIHGDSGLNWSNGGNSSIRPALEKLMTKRTVVILPIINGVAGTGVNSQFKMATFGKFYLYDPFPNDPNNGGISQQGGSNAYIDLVYLGPANGNACLVTNVDPQDDITLVTPVPSTVRIPFQINPRYSEPAVPAQPIAYQLIVDVSGSMSWNFDGEGTYNGDAQPLKNTTGGTNYKCEYANTTSKLTYFDNCTGGPNSSWWRFNERRIYVTKQAIESFVNDLNPEDVMRYTAFTTRRDSGFSGNTKVVPSSGFTGNKALLLSELGTLGSLSSDPYRTTGSTPGPQALSKARDIILQAPATAPSGKKYRKVVIYLTDGVANVFIDGTSNQARDICGDRSVTAAVNSPDCQIGFSETANKLRPISAMIDEANKIKLADPQVQIYVLALAGVATDGLTQVASSSSMIYQADKPGFVGAILNTIRDQAVGSTCVAKGGAKFIDRIPAANHPDFPGVYALPPDEYGKAAVYNESGVIVGNYPIKHDPVSGILGVEAPLAPGNYQISAFIGYKGPDQPKQISRSYNSLSWDQVKYADRLSFTVGANDSLNQTRVLKDIFVDLDPNILVCPKK